MIRATSFLLTCALVLIAAPSAQARTCRKTQTPQTQWTQDIGVQRLEQRIDFDGDEKPDRLEVSIGSGSGMGGGSALATLSSGQEHRAEIEFTFYEMIQRDPVPIELLEPQHARLREAMEDAFYKVTCSKPDASLQRLLHPSAPLQWVDGPVVLPEMYAVVDRQASPPVWISYKGHMHGELTLADKSKTHRLYKTAHGVVLTDAKQSRHAWLYVFPGRNRKLRFPSVKDAALDGPQVRITLAQERFVDTRVTTEVVEEVGRVVVDLKTGKTTTEWVPIRQLIP